jgi:hypothetical protein
VNLIGEMAIIAIFVGSTLAVLKFTIV